DLHRVFDEEDGKFEFLLDALNQADEVGFFRRVHAGGGFVEEEEFRLGGEAADDFEAALFAVGKTFRGGVAETAEVENFEQLLGAAGDGGFVALEAAETDQRLDRRGGAVEVAGDADVVEDGERAEEADVLE